MTRETFDLQLSALNERLLALGTMVTRVQEQAIRALADRNADLANELIAGDHAINQAQHDIEDQCLFLIASQQPVARDLRLIFSISSIAWELERMADHAKGIATLALRLGGSTDAETIDRHPTHGRDRTRAVDGTVGRLY